MSGSLIKMSASDYDCVCVFTDTFMLFPCAATPRLMFGAGVPGWRWCTQVALVYPGGGSEQRITDDDRAISLTCKDRKRSFCLCALHWLSNEVIMKVIIGNCGFGSHLRRGLFFVFFSEFTDVVWPKVLTQH